MIFIAEIGLNHNGSMDLGFELINRPDYLSAEYITVMDVIKYSVEEMSINNYNPEMVIYASSTYPFRPRVLFDEIIEQMKNFDFTSINFNKLNFLKKLIK